MRDFGKSLLLTGKLLKRYSGKHVSKLIIQILAFSFLICYDAVMVPAILSKVYEALEAQNLKSLYLACGCGALVIALSFVLSYLNNVYLDMNSFRIGLAANRNICRKLFSLSFDGLNSRYEEGDIQKRIDECTGSIAAVFPLIVSILANIFSMVALLRLGGRISAVLAGITLAVMLVSYIIARRESRSRSCYEKRRQEAEAKSGTVLYQTIKEQAVLKMYGADALQWNVYQKQREAAWGAKWRQEQAGLTAGSTTETFTSVMRGVLGGFLFRFYQSGSLDSGQIASSFSIFDKLKSVANSFSDPISMASTYMVSAGRLDEMLRDGGTTGLARREEEEATQGGFPVLFMDHISYMVGERCVLQDISLNVRKWEKVAIIGESGCGKSTLLKLIGGLNHAEQGTIDLMGVDPGTASNEELRCRVSYIPSESHLYTGDIQSNIGMNLDREDVAAFETACVAAEVTEFFQTGKEDTSGGNAVELSGGQAQRVNIARGLVNKVPILLADEPDAGLPPAQGRRIMENLLQSTDTAIVVTHHHENLNLFDRVVFLEDGKISLMMKNMTGGNENG